MGARHTATCWVGRNSIQILTASILIMPHVGRHLLANACCGWTSIHLAAGGISFEDVCMYVSTNKLSAC